MLLFFDAINDGLSVLGKTLYELGWLLDARVLSRSHADVFEEQPFNGKFGEAFNLSVIEKLEGNRKDPRISKRFKNRWLRFCRVYSFAHEDLVEFGGRPFRDPKYVNFGNN